MKRDITHYFFLVNKIPVGHVGVSFYTSFPDGSTALLHNAVILPDQRNKGYGKEMISIILHLLTKRGIKKIMLLTEECRQAAKKVYVETGFTRSTDILFVYKVDDEKGVSLPTARKRQ